MKKNWICVLIMIIYILSLCTGCSKSDNKEISLAVVAGIHANVPDIPLNSSSIKEAIYNSCYSYGNVSFILADGSPAIYYQTDVPEPEVSGLTETKKKTIANGYTDQLLGELVKINPMAAETDTLKAIQQASKALSSGSETSDKVMIIMDSGLSTTGYLDFTEGLLNADTDSIIVALREAEAIPDLSDISVVWMFNGQTAAPQPELSERQKNKLQEIWNGILVAGGAKEVTFSADIASESAYHDYPYVSVVDVEERNIEVEMQQTEPAKIVIEEPIETVILDNTSVEFVGDEANFVDEKRATDNLKVLAKQLLGHPDNKVYVIGTTASGGKDFCKQLSIDRANAVVGALIELGVPESQLIPMGLGFDDPWHVPDLDEAGRQIEELARQNRKVLIVDVNGNDAEKLN